MMDRWVCPRCHTSAEKTTVVCRGCGHIYSGETEIGDYEFMQASASGYPTVPKVEIVHHDGGIAIRVGELVIESVSEVRVTHDGSGGESLGTVWFKLLADKVVEVGGTSKTWNALEVYES